VHRTNIIFTSTRRLCFHPRSYVCVVCQHNNVNINNFLLTEREVCTEKCRTEVFFVQTGPVGRGLYKKTEVRYFSVQTEQARLIKSLLYGIYRHLYSKQTRNAWFEMYISSVVHIWSKIPMYSFFFTKNHLQTSY
jgi:hypothetical protein